MGLWARFRKARAIRAYLREGPALLERRYGVDAHYSPQRVLATFASEKLSAELGDYACALFSDKEAFADWALEQCTARRSSATPRPAVTRRILAALTPPTRTQAYALYQALRDEVAEGYNHGKHEFIPKHFQEPSTEWSRSRNAGANANWTGFRNG